MCARTKMLNNGAAKYYEAKHVLFTHTQDERKKKTIELLIQYSIIVKAYSSESAACSGFCAALSCKAS